MTLFNVKDIEKAARNEIAEESREVAIEKLKELYRKREKAALVVKTIDREIANYLEDVSDNVTYESAGVDTTGE